MEHDEQKEYEISFLGRDEEGARAVARALSAQACTVTVEGPVERIELSYPVNGASAAHFGFFHFRGMPSAVREIERALATDPAVLRVLVLTPPVVREKPRIPMEGRSERPAPVVSSGAEQPAAVTGAMPLSNEALEKRIEEISR